MQLEKKENNDGHNVVHKVNKSQRNKYFSILSFFYLHLANQIFVAV